MKTKTSSTKTAVNLRKLVREELLKNRKSFLMFNPPKTKKQLVTEKIQKLVREELLKEAKIDKYEKIIKAFETYNDKVQYLDNEDDVTSPAIIDKQLNILINIILKQLNIVPSAQNKNIVSNILSLYWPNLGTDDDGGQIIITNKEIYIVCKEIEILVSTGKKDPEISDAIVKLSSGKKTVTGSVQKVTDEHIFIKWENHSKIEKYDHSSLPCWIY
jgi:hypothetical protein